MNELLVILAAVGAYTLVVLPYFGYKLIKFFDKEIAARAATRSSKGQETK